MLWKAILVLLSLSSPILGGNIEFHNDMDAAFPKWATAGELCAESSVVCDDDNKVTSLSMNLGEERGCVPRSIGSLSSLRELQINNADLTCQFSIEGIDQLEIASFVYVKGLSLEEEEWTKLEFLHDFSFLGCLRKMFPVVKMKALRVLFSVAYAWGRTSS